MSASEAVEGVERRRDAERTKSELLAVATDEFARRGFSGARVAQIAAPPPPPPRLLDDV